MLFEVSLRGYSLNGENPMDHSVQKLSLKRGQCRELHGVTQFRDTVAMMPIGAPEEVGDIDTGVERGYLICYRWQAPVLFQDPTTIIFMMNRDGIIDKTAQATGIPIACKLKLSPLA
jgi:hypothetical protein